MTKPKSLSNPDRSTKVYSILRFFLDNTDLRFDSKKDAKDYYTEHTGIPIDPTSFYKIISFYNEGLYSIDGTNADNKKIELLMGITETFVDNKDLFCCPEQMELDGLEDLNYISKGNSIKLQESDKTFNQINIIEADDEVAPVADKTTKPTAEEWQQLCKDRGVDHKTCKMFWDKTSGDLSILYVNPIHPKIRQMKLEESLSKVVDKINTDKLTKWKPVQKDSQKGLNVVITDAHVGMHIDEGGIFEYEYDGCIYKEKMQEVFSNIMKEYRTHGHFDVVVINNLGDQEDGWDQLTTRGGHKLPQNMTETEVFKLCVETHVEMIESILEQKITNKVILRSCINSNHSATFSEIVATGVKLIIDRMYDRDVVEIDILDKFMSHRTFGDHTFILTHGKDKKQMFRGLPLYLNDKTTNYINDYIRHYGIDSPHIHVQKGDLHQIGFEKKVNFDYRNFGSFSPPSSWVQHNFGDSYSCYTIQVIEKYSAEISSTDYFLDYRKAN